MTYFYILVVDVYANHPEYPTYFIKFGITDKSIHERISRGSGLACSLIDKETGNIDFSWDRHDCKVWYCKEYDYRLEAAIVEGEYKLKCVKDPEYFIPVPGKCEWYAVQTIDRRLLPDEL